MISINRLFDAVFFLFIITVLITPIVLIIALLEYVYGIKIMVIFLSITLFVLSYIAVGNNEKRGITT